MGWRTTVTSTALLDGLRDGSNRTLWAQYVDRYRPVLLRTARRAGLGEDAAEDVAQATLLAFAESYRRGRYDRDRGRLRHWLFGIARRQIRSWYRREDRPEVSAGSAGEENGVPFAEAPDGLEAAWEAEWRAALVRQCIEEVRHEVEPQTLEAFQLFAVEGLSAREVAERLGMTPNAVYGVKRRVLRRVRELLPLMEDAW